MVRDDGGVKEVGGSEGGGRWKEFKEIKNRSYRIFYVIGSESYRRRGGLG